MSYKQDAFRSWSGQLGLLGTPCNSYFQTVRLFFMGRDRFFHLTWSLTLISKVHVEKSLFWTIHHQPHVIESKCDVSFLCSATFHLFRFMDFFNE